MKKIFFILFTMMIIFTPFSVSAEAGYVINNFDVEIEVNSDNTMKVTENIEVDFSLSSHGILESIPFDYEITDSNQTVHYKPKIKLLEATELYSKKYSEGYLDVALGSAYHLVKGIKNYKLVYEYDLNNDKFADFDLFYHDIIGYSWDTEILNATFKVTMPKEFDKDKIMIISNAFSDNIEYNTSGNVITGKITKKLAEGEGINLKIRLYDGYFDKKIFAGDLFLMLISIFGTLSLVLIIKFLFGRRRNIPKVINFYPPEGMNSAEMARYYKSNIEYSDINSLFVYLANKGYLKIESNGKETMIKVIKPYDGNNEIERIFMEGLIPFAGKDKYVKMDLLLYGFADTLTRIAKILSSKQHTDNSLFRISMKKMASFISVLGLCLTILMPLIYFNEYMELILVIILLLILGNVYKSVRKINEPIHEKIILFTFVGAIITFLYLFAGYYFFGQLTLPVYTSLIMNYWIYAMIFVLALILYEVEYNIINTFHLKGAQTERIIGEIEGFREFLITVEKDTLEKYVAQNPKYFYDILPYTFVLDVSDVWMNRFDDIALVEPEWFTNNTHGDVRKIYYIITDDYRRSNDLIDTQMKRKKEHEMNKRMMNAFNSMGRNHSINSGFSGIHSRSSSRGSRGGGSRTSGGGRW